MIARGNSGGHTCSERRATKKERGQTLCRTPSHGRAKTETAWYLVYLNALFSSWGVARPSTTAAPVSGDEDCTSAESHGKRQQPRQDKHHRQSHQPPPLVFATLNVTCNQSLAYSLISFVSLSALSVAVPVCDSLRCVTPIHGTAGQKD